MAQTWTLAGSLLVVIAADSIGDNAGVFTKVLDYQPTTIDIGQDAFNEMFWDSAHHILKRECSSCSHGSHKVIYYRRYTMLQSFDLYTSTYNWESTNNILGTDFDLFSTLSDALSQSNPWTWCNYDDNNIGMFGDCGPTGRVNSEWTSKDRGGDTASFFIYTATMEKAANDGFHWIAPGRATNSAWNDYENYPDLQLCQNDSSNQAPISSPNSIGNDIAVSCCSMDGTKGVRPDCDAYPRNYAQAVALCASYGYRLCTLQELLYDELTTDTGCDFSVAYNWVSDECDLDSTAKSAENAAVSTSDSGDRWVLNPHASTWSDADEYCRTHYNTSLATITSEEEAQDLLLFLRNYTDNKSPWIGLNDIEKEGVWTWSSGHSWY